MALQQLGVKKAINIFKFDGTVNNFVYGVFLTQF